MRVKVSWLCGPKAAMCRNVKLQRKNIIIFLTVFFIALDRLVCFYQSVRNEWFEDQLSWPLSQFEASMGSLRVKRLIKVGTHVATSSLCNGSRKAQQTRNENRRRMGAPIARFIDDTNPQKTKTPAERRAGAHTPQRARPHGCGLSVRNTLRRHERVRVM